MRKEQIPRIFIGSGVEGGRGKTAFQDLCSTVSQNRVSGQPCFLDLNTRIRDIFYKCNNKAKLPNRNIACSFNQ